MITCKECQYWKRNKPKTTGYPGYVEEYNEFMVHFGTCAHEAFVYDSIWQEREDLPKNGLVYEDYEGFAANFQTGEDFGCIHGEKEPPNEG